MTPEFCKNCKKSCPSGDTCTHFKTCKHWRGWFRKEWAGIQRAAAALKKKYAEGNNEKTTE